MKDQFFKKEKIGAKSKNLDGYIWKKENRGKDGYTDNCLQKHMLGTLRKQNCFIITGNYSQLKEDLTNDNQVFTENLLHRQHYSRHCVYTWEGRKHIIQVSTGFYPQGIEV